MLEEYMPTLLYAIIAIIAIAIIIIFSPRYTVVQAHLAHVIVRGSGRKVYCSRKGYKASYWFIPILQKRTILPLENIKFEIPHIPLRDKDMAKYCGDVRCWISIEDPELAAEKLGKITGDTGKNIDNFFTAIKDDIQDLIQAVTRNSSMTMDVFATMKFRKKFSNEVQKEISPVLSKDWGIRVANLEVIHFEDVEGYNVVKNLETRQDNLIKNETRKKVAMQNKDAAISEAMATKETEVKKAEAEEEYMKRQALKDQEVGVAQQEKDLAISEKQAAANEKAVEAKRKLDVGTAEVDRDAVIATATGDAKSTELTGFAEANVDKAKLVAEAEGTEKKAKALKEYTDAGLSLEVIKANIEIRKAQFEALGKGFEKANINLVTSGESSILGIPVSAETGANIGAMLIAMQNQGIDISELIKKLPISETAKLAIAANAGVEVVKTARKEDQQQTKRTRRSKT